MIFLMNNMDVSVKQVCFVCQWTIFVDTCLVCQSSRCVDKCVCLSVFSYEIIIVKMGVNS